MSKPNNRAVASEDVKIQEVQKTIAAKDAPMVRVRARAHLAEEFKGELRRFAPGEEFELPAPRADVLGHLIEVLK